MEWQGRLHANNVVVLNRKRGTPPIYSQGTELVWLEKP